MIVATLLGGIVSFVLEIYGLMIITRVVISWFQIKQTNTFIQMIITFTEPVLIPVRKLVPPVSGLDLSPFVVLAVLWLIKQYF